MEFFVYGTLTDSGTARTVLDSFEYRESATLVGLRRVDGRYPTLVPGGSTAGRILHTDDVTALDRYEGVDRGLYVRVTVPRENGGTVETYVGDPDRLGVDERSGDDDERSGDDDFEDRVRDVLGQDVFVRTDSSSR